ncbi:S49 family peptidase [Tenacibaculum sp. nBUS_03]|uniref:S49 family peptidase n=1 Tax=Tenacibaculum sp. nBUS_03 TaxID=3395320 RepID=UPI003EB87EFF
MKSNLHSLLSSNWMLEENSKASLVPFLFKIMNGSNQELTLNATEFSTIENSGHFQNVASGKNNSGSVGVIKMHHPIFKYNQECEPKGTQSIISQLEKWKEDSSIVGVLYDVNSGGGQASGTSELAEYNFNYPKPIGVYTNDLIGSAAYYLSAGCKFIVANKHADFIGCIGTMFQKLDVSGVLEKKGAKLHEIYADLSPEKNLQSRALKEGNNKPLLEKILNPNAQKFHDDIKMYRPSISEKALKGDIFNPDDALKEGLIDEIGDFQTAIDKVFDLANNNTSNSNINSNTNMSKTIEVPTIQTVLGYDAPIGANENGAYFQETELQTLEQALVNKDQKATNIQAKLDATNLTNSKAETAINAALDNAEIEYNAEHTLSQKINLLNNQRNEFAKNSATTKTQTSATADPEIGDSAPVKEYAHNKEANNFLK